MYYAEQKSVPPLNAREKGHENLEARFFFELILKINNPQLRLATTWPLHSGRP